jgi:truncated hemoglobin YjbI
MAVTVVDRAFETYQNVSGFSDEDIRILASIGPLVGPNLVRMTELFYATLLTDRETAALLEGRVEALKVTHLAWLKELFSGISADALVARQEMIGRVHVKAKIPPMFVSASMSFLRGAFPVLLAATLEEKGQIIAATTAILRTLDVCQYVFDRAYNECLMENLGVTPALLNKLMTT